MSKYVDRLRKSLEIRSNQGKKRLIDWQDLLSEMVAPLSYRQSPARMVRYVLEPSANSLIEEGLVVSYEVVREEAYAYGFNFESPKSVLFVMGE